MKQFPTEMSLQDASADKFGFKNLANKLVENIFLQMSLPNCFGLYGNWGSGKSTLVNFIQKEIETNYSEDYFPIYFEPWKYEYSDHKDLMFALLNEIKEQGNIPADGKAWKKILVNTAAIGSGVVRVAGLNDVEKTDSEIQHAKKTFLKEHQIWADAVTTFQNDFKEVVDQVLKKKKATNLLILIDDLDRCLPENTVKLLEGIKNHLFTERVLFVLAVDRRVVGEMIQKKYGLHEGYGDEYLTKIIHYYYELPNLSLVELVKESLIGHGLQGDERQAMYIVNLLQVHAKEPRLAKHLLHQFGIAVNLAEGVREAINNDQGGVLLQYYFVASYLLTKYAVLFGSRNVKTVLDNITRGISHRNNAEEYRSTLEKAAYISVLQRDEIQAVLEHAVRTGREAGGKPAFTETGTLAKCMNDLKIHQTSS